MHGIHLAEEVFVVTHAANHVGNVALQEEIAGTLDDPRFENVPRIVLVNDLYSAGDALRERATVIHPSAQRHLGDLEIRARTVHLAGGHLRHCLGRTGGDLLHQFLASNRDRLDLIAHGGLIFDFASTLKMSFQRSHDPAAVLDQAAWYLMGLGDPWPSYRPSYGGSPREPELEHPFHFGDKTLTLRFAGMPALARHPMFSVETAPVDR